MAQLPLGRLLPERRAAEADLLHFISTLALTQEDRSGGKNPGWVRRWTRPVKVHIEGDVTGAVRDEVARVLTTISRWTRLPFRTSGISSRRHGNLTLRLLPHDEVRDHYGRRGPVCMTWTFGNGGRLHTALMDLSDHYADCLEHEFLHAVGIDNHWTAPEAISGIRSVMAPRGSAARSRSYSRWDEMMVRLLYDRRLKPGMPQDRALVALRQILATEFLET